MDWQWLGRGCWFCGPSPVCVAARKPFVFAIRTVFYPSAWSCRARRPDTGRTILPYPCRVHASPRKNHAPESLDSVGQSKMKCHRSGRMVGDGRRQTGDGRRCTVVEGQQAKSCPAHAYRCASRFHVIVFLSCCSGLLLWSGLLCGPGPGGSHQLAAAGCIALHACIMRRQQPPPVGRALLIPATTSKSTPAACV